MGKILTMPFDGSTESATATTAPQDVSLEDAATFDVLRKMREDILCCVLKPDQRLRFGELRQRYGTSVGTLREALSHLVSEGLARTEAGRGFHGGRYCPESGVHVHYPGLRRGSGKARRRRVLAEEY